jgi:hypothetical protein
MLDNATINQWMDNGKSPSSRAVFGIAGKKVEYSRNRTEGKRKRREGHWQVTRT